MFVPLFTYYYKLVLLSTAIFVFKNFLRISAICRMNKKDRECVLPRPCGSFYLCMGQASSKVRKQVTIQQVVSREVFWHVFCQTPITEVDFKCVLARNCEGTEQLRKQDISPAELPPVFPVSYFSFVPGYRMFFTFSLPVSEYPDKF